MSGLALVADIGGTNARFALAEIDNGARLREVQKFRAEDFETVGDAAAAYLESVKEKPTLACLAVAGPVTDAAVEFTNSPWVLDIPKTKAALGLDRLTAVNDFEALAAGVRALAREDFLAVKPGPGAPGAPVLVMGPGTGLGQALIVPCGDGGERIVTTEGGHIAFAPRSDEEIAVMKFIAREHKRVSVERVLSGRGLVNIHRALCALEGVQRVSLQADEITKAARDQSLPIAVRTVAMFCGMLGAAAGDAVLATGARAGVVLGGGVLPKIRDIFLGSDFVSRFLDKGRMRAYVDAAPVDLIVGDNAALTGAAVILGRERA